MMFAALDCSFFTYRLCAHGFCEKIPPKAQVSQTSALARYDNPITIEAVATLPHRCPSHLHNLTDTWQDSNDRKELCETWYPG